MQSADVNLRPDGLRYRVLLMAEANAPVVAQTIEYHLDGTQRWSKTATDTAGEAMLGTDRGFALAGAGKPPTVRLRMTLPAAGLYALVVEAVAKSKAAEVTVVGIGSVILNEEQVKPQLGCQNGRTWCGGWNGNN